MQVFARSIIAHITLAVIALWLGAGPARAGGGGADAGSLQNLLSDLCGALGEIPCPNLPTVSQIVLEIAALKTTPPDVVRYEGAFSPTTVVNAVNPPGGSPAINLSNVAPLAFVSGAPAKVSDPGDPDANSFFYAATDGAPGQVSTTLNLVYDYPPLTNPSFNKGQTVAQLSLPLVILNSNGSETEAPTTILIQGATNCKTSPCFTATATGSFGTVDPAKLGLVVTFVFQSSANSATPHAIFSVQANLVVTNGTDPSYFAPDSIFPAGFHLPGPNGAPSKVLPSSATGIGIAPYAAPKCSPANAACVTTSAGSTYPYCATIAGQRAVAAFLAIGKFGETYVSAPRQPLSGVTCPF